MSGIIGESVRGKSGLIMGLPPAFCVNGAAQTATAGWPPAPLNLDDNTTAANEPYFVRDCVLNPSANYITLTHGGTWQLTLEVRFDMGANGATAGQNMISYVYVEKGAFVNVNTYDYHLSVGASMGTRGDEDGATTTVSSIIHRFPAGVHIWPGAFQRSNVTTGVTKFLGLLLR